MIGALIIGLIVGAIAKFFMPGKDPGGWIITMLLGIAGAAIASWIGVGAGWYGENEPAGLVASVAGSMLLLYLYRVFNRRSALT
ncbi:MAG: GlsB/YeaQ/YmgE family stress response membrane protein [Bdellovibrionaceae bacterium]|nr:GlsB/YeaQ/YmgE family stress response membrane protein [Pseudobdellovibrionaceae bacterium]